MSQAAFGDVNEDSQNIFLSPGNLKKGSGSGIGCIIGDLCRSLARLTWQSQLSCQQYGFDGFCKWVCDKSSYPMFP